MLNRVVYAVTTGPKEVKDGGRISYLMDQSVVRPSHEDVFDVHVTVHRDIFLIIKPTSCTNFSNLFLERNFTCFGQFLSIIRFSLYTQQWYMSYSLRAGSGCSILILLASCQQTCVTYTIAVCTGKNS